MPPRFPRLKPATCWMASYPTAPKFRFSPLPMRYGVVLDFEMARKSTRRYDPFDVLKDEPNMIVHAGGVEANTAYLDKARDRHNTKVMGNWHPYNRIDPDQPQTRVPFLAGNIGGVGHRGRRRPSLRL